eukprot:CAMPEP_0119407470 /NCGR_PEP_ID=MMETSP1335-20130426/1343_1 /TAXON_ID=259385 /ORGANISM="Chrysoculter rhomboideus, Strain RCC1486" /LENGTH=59 /DNA_ID=CAMNT_0007431577 /DNA_START=11 /DNA_END=186 /DNA_ORIENTATION=+
MKQLDETKLILVRLRDECSIAMRPRPTGERCDAQPPARTARSVRSMRRSRPLSSAGRRS